MVLICVADLAVVVDKGMVLFIFDEVPLFCSVLFAFTAKKKLILSSAIYTYIQWIEIKH